MPVRKRRGAPFVSAASLFLFLVAAGCGSGEPSDQERAVYLRELNQQARAQFGDVTSEVTALIPGCADLVQAKVSGVSYGRGGRINYPIDRPPEEVLQGDSATFRVRITPVAVHSGVARAEMTRVNGEWAMAGDADEAEARCSEWSRWPGDQLGEMADKHFGNLSREVVAFVPDCEGFPIETKVMAVSSAPDGSDYPIDRQAEGIFEDPAANYQVRVTALRRQMYGSGASVAMKRVDGEWAPASDTDELQEACHDWKHKIPVEEPASKKEADKKPPPSTKSGSARPDNNRTPAGSARRYLSTLRGIDAGFETIADTTLISLGDIVCAYTYGGASSTELTELVNATGLDMRKSGRVVAAAKQVYC